MKDKLDLILANYDVILIGCQPALSWHAINAFTASKQILVVVGPGYFELDSIIQRWKTVAVVKVHFNLALHTRGILFTMID